MLEVHAPHEPVHTWSGFFIHIAIISIGLLLAIGLEQGVEYIHHKHQASEMTARLQAESRSNRNVLSADLGEADALLASVHDHLDRIDSAHGLGDRADCTSVALPVWVGYPPTDTTWLMLRDSALLPVMPDVLVEDEFKIEVTLSAYYHRKWEVERGLVQAGALLQADCRNATPIPEARESLRVALLALAEQVELYRQGIMRYDEYIEAAMANRSIGAPAGKH